MDPASPHGVAVLKSVNIAFPKRPKDYDYYSGEPFIPPNTFGDEVKTHFEYIDNHN